MKVGILHINSKYLTLSVAYMVFIYYLSSLTGTATGRSTQLNIIITNALHIPLFGILAALYLMAFKGEKGIAGASGNIFIFCFVLTAGYALFDEWHQSHIKDRTFSCMDIVLDGIGAGSSLCTLAYVRKRIGNSKEKIERSM